MDKTLNCNGMNEALFNLYGSKWDKLTALLTSIIEDQTLQIKAANPLLLCIDNEEDYKSCDIRLMIFGQETNSWYPNENGNIKNILNNYDDFFNGGECWIKRGHFWGGVSRFLFSLQNKYPEKKICLVWNNIVKIGKQGDKGFPPDYIYKIERENFHIIPQELEILKPTIVLFLTGPNYDRVIKDNFGDLNYETLPNSTERQISRITLPGVQFTYRTYHPNYLWRNDIDDYFDTIIEDIVL